MGNRRPWQSDCVSFFEDVLPTDINELAENLNKYRDTIKGDFEEKVEKLNEFTKGLVSKKK